MRILLSLAMLFAGVACSQDKTALTEVRMQFLLCSTKAIANFRSADAIAGSLERRGMVLNGDLSVLRENIERSLDRTEASLAKGDIESALQTLKRAEGLLARYSERLGGK